jgi:hypothetical protein
MIVSPRTFLASLLMLSAAASIAAAETTIPDCSFIAAGPDSTSDCCNCVCGHSQCAVFKRLDQEFFCVNERVHCYDEDETPTKDQQEEGEWVLRDKDVDTTTIVANPEAKIISPHLLQCRLTPITPENTEECCNCACSASNCAIFKFPGESLVCDPLKIHCYGDDEDETFANAVGEWVETYMDDSDSNDTETQEAAPAATSDGGEGSTSPMLADCSAVDVSLDDMGNCCSCACGHHDCAIYHSVGSEIRCDKLKIHCYDHQEGEDDDDEGYSWTLEGNEKSGASNMTGMAALTAAVMAVLSFMW